MTMWMVRAGRGGRWIEDFLERSVVGLGWHAAGDSTRFSSKEQIFDSMRSAYPDMSEGTAASGASQLWRFMQELNVGDDVVTYDADARAYHLGRITGEARYRALDIEDLTLSRFVEWHSKSVSRDALSIDARNRLGSVLTLFKVPADVADELRSPADPYITSEISDEGEDDVVDPFSNLFEDATLRIADRISEMSWEDMERLVAALLRAMGYKTDMTARGSDRGSDIFASPDGFGFEQPRIVVEVKHRKDTKITAEQLRGFLGGRHKDDRGLYVSTGGFSKDARYEADRASIPLKLMTLDDLARAVVENYAGFDSEGRSILPLRELYWPV